MSTFEIKFYFLFHSVLLASAKQRCHYYSIMSAYPDGLIPFGPNANCTLEICPLEWSIFRYQPSIPANVLFIAIFGVLLAAHVIQGIWYRTWGYMASMMSGCALEIVGYVGRIMLNRDPFNFNAFLMQIGELIRF